MHAYIYIYIYIYIHTQRICAGWPAGWPAGQLDCFQAGPAAPAVVSNEISSIQYNLL